MEINNTYTQRLLKFNSEKYIENEQSYFCYKLRSNRNSLSKKKNKNEQL